MKKYIYILIAIVIIGIGFFVINELTYSPLKEKDFKVLFSDYNGRVEKKCSIDFLGWSPEGAVFDLYVYEMEKVFIDAIYPDFKSGWKNISVLDGIIFSKWRRDIETLH